MTLSNIVLYVTVGIVYAGTAGYILVWESMVRQIRGMESDQMNVCHIDAVPVCMLK